MKRFLQQPSSNNKRPAEFDLNRDDKVSITHKRAMDTANRRIFGNQSFRAQQEVIIEAVLMNQDVFVVMPTGGGKVYWSK